MAEYKPARILKEYTIPAGGTISDAVNPFFHVATVNVSAGADVSVTITFGGKEYTGSFSVVSDFGRPAKGAIGIQATNSGTADETLTVEILGTLEVRK